jgi:hypothetical protein
MRLALYSNAIKETGTFGLVTLDVKTETADDIHTGKIVIFRLF